MKKRWLRLICLIIGIMLVAGLAVACNNGDETNKSKSYIIEAESMDLSDYHGVAQSANPDGADTILGANSGAPSAAINSLNKKKADGTNYNDGYFVGFFNTAGKSFTFTLESDTAAKAKFSLRLGSEYGNMQFNASNLTIKVNGTAIAFNSFTVAGPSGGNWGQFVDYAIDTEIDLLKNDLTGENSDIVIDGAVKVARPIRVQNTIEIILGANSYWPGFTAGGFGIDCLKLTTEAGVTWADYWVGGWADDWDQDEDLPITRVGNKDLI